MNIDDISFKIYPANYYQTKIEAFYEGKKIGGLIVDVKLKELDERGINMFELEVIRNILEKTGDNMKTITIDNKEIEISDESFKAFKEQFMKDNVRWKPEYDEDYWYINFYKEVLGATWFDYEFDNIQYTNKNVYKTKAECDRALEIRNILNKYSYNFTEEEWEDYDIGKYHLYYDFEDAEIGCGCEFHCKWSSRYFKDEKTAMEVAELIGAEDYKKYIAFGGIK